MKVRGEPPTAFVNLCPLPYITCTVQLLINRMITKISLSLDSPLPYRPHPPSPQQSPFLLQLDARPLGRGFTPLREFLGESFVFHRSTHVLWELLEVGNTLSPHTYGRHPAYKFVFVVVVATNEERPIF